MTTAYPLAWPDGWPRTRAEDRKAGSSVFTRSHAAGGPWTFAEARDRLNDELWKHTSHPPVLSTNFDVGRNGPMEGRGRRPDDEGVAIYFDRDGKPFVMACDRFHDAEGNMRSLTLALEALRQLERHGGGVMMERAYQGFSALPPPNDGPREKPWREVFGFIPAFGTIASGLMPEQCMLIVSDTYRRKAAELGPEHPDLKALNIARDQAKKELMK